MVLEIDLTESTIYDFHLINDPGTSTQDQDFIRKLPKGVTQARGFVRTMSTRLDKSLIAVCQFTSNADKHGNFEICKDLITKAKNQGACMVFLPECYDFVGETRAQSYELAEPIDGETVARYRGLAKSLQLWLSLGGGHEQVEDKANKVYNSHVIINSCGDIVAVYRKVHLFEVDIPGRVKLKESDFTVPGTIINNPIESPVGKIGLGTCYDLRFPEFSTCLRKMGAEILTYPSAFTHTTGKAHWEALLRARAIENQTYVVAAAQFGQHNSKRRSYGHAMIIDPWGGIVDSCQENTGLAFAQIDRSLLLKIREEMPVYMHRRTDLYPVIYPRSVSISSDDFNANKSYEFGHVNLSADQLFHRSALSMAFVNLKPILPGHVLVAPIRKANRLADLASDEVSDLFSVVQNVQKVIETYFGATSTTISIQDGKDAGQSIEHVHVHIIPRRANDLGNNDDIYYHLQHHDKEDNRKPRTIQEMASEALTLRVLFHPEFK